MLNKRLEKAGSLETVHTHTHTPYSYKRIVGQSGERELHLDKWALFLMLKNQKKAEQKMI